MNELFTSSEKEKLAIIKKMKVKKKVLEILKKKQKKKMAKIVYEMTLLNMSRFLKIFPCK